MELVKLIEQWHEDRNLIAGSTDKDQVLKLVQELGELSDSVCKEKDMRDDLGDMLVVMINIMKRNNITIEECLQKAYDDIKDRKGRMVDGIFVKEE
jgi:NTP pyrophosphatase (non-canonical NTP hydrolase)